jgi:hypothetical protein
MRSIDAAADPVDLSYQLAGDVYRLIVHTLRALLPPPEDETPEADTASASRAGSATPTRRGS